MQDERKNGETGGKTLRYTTLKSEWKLAWLSTFVIGLLIHAYKFTNYLPNHDALLNDYADQDILTSGRWFLSIACGFSSYFDLPWVVGILSLSLIALTTVVIVELFQIKRRSLIVLTGGLLVSFPGVTETFFFEYTADGYMLAMLLSALAVYASTFERRKLRYAMLSAALICLSCGIYQAYVSFALLLMLCYFVKELLEGQRTNRECLRYLGKQLCVFAAGLAVYYLIWKLCMLARGVSATNYAGIDEVGSLSQFGSPIKHLLTGAWNTVRTLLLYVTDWNLFYYRDLSLFLRKMTPHIILCLLFLLACLVGFIVACRKSGLTKRKLQFTMAILALVLAVPGACMWYYVSFELYYRPMMLVSLATFYILALLLFDRWCGMHLRRGLLILLVATVFNNGLMANISYFLLNKCYESSYAIGVEMTMRLHKIESEEDFKQIAVTGITEEFKEESILGRTGMSSRVPMLAYYLRSNFFYDQEHIAMFLEKTFNETPKFASLEECHAMEQREDVAAMGVWPAVDSMKVIDGTLVIKMSNTVDDDG